MRLRSFDIFDTVLTRIVAHPWDVHLGVAEHLIAQGLYEGDPDGFIQARVQAENASRQQVPSGEVNLDEIYQQLARNLSWSRATQEQAQSMEVELEQRFLRTFPLAVRRVAQARQLADRILFVSDMYLPVSSLQKVLVREGLWKEGDELYVSHAYRCSKANRGLYQRIAHDHPGHTSWHHGGDNQQADVESARLEGIEAEWLNEAHLSRYEKQVRGSHRVVSMGLTQLAGAMRLARLSAPAGLQGNGPVIWNTATNVVGPLLFAFVFWCLERARQEKLSRLYFVARDGQILKRIADILAPAWGYSVECRYLYGSRQAWRPAAIAELGEAELDWLVPTDPLHPITLQQSMARFGSTAQVHRSELEQAGFAESSWNQLMDPTAVQRLRQWLKDHRDAVLAVTSRRRNELVSYLEQEGVLQDESFALVDIGWYGNLQRSLGAALQAAGLESKSSLRGYYFGLFPQALSVRSPTQRMSDFWSENCPAEESITLQNITLFEVFTAADHGSVMGYRADAATGRMDAVLVEPTNREALEWGLQTMQDAIVEWTRRCVQCIPQGSVSLETWIETARSLFVAFHRKPGAEEARVWGAFPLGGQPIEHVKSQLVPEWTRVQLWRALRHVHLRPTSWWMEGSMAVQPDWLLRIYLKLRRWRQRRTAAKVA